MTIDTGKRTIALQVQKQFLAVLTGLLFATAYFPVPREFLDTYLYSHYLVSFGLLGLYILYQFFFWFRDIMYIYVSDESLVGMLRVRHFRLLPMSNSKHAIEIPLEEFLRYDVERAWHGLRLYVRIWQQAGQEIYRYPRFSITLLKKTEKAQLFALLDQYTQDKRAESTSEQ